MVCKLLAISDGVIYFPQGYDWLPVSCPFSCVYLYLCKRAQLNLLFHQAKLGQNYFLILSLVVNLGLVDTCSYLPKKS